MGIGIEGADGGINEPDSENPGSIIPAKDIQRVSKWVLGGGSRHGEQDGSGQALFSRGKARHGLADSTEGDGESFGRKYQGDTVARHAGKRHQPRISHWPDVN